MSDRKLYHCNKCKSEYWLYAALKYCVCGGLLVQDYKIEDIFPWMKEQDDE